MEISSRMAKCDLEGALGVEETIFELLTRR